MTNEQAIVRRAIKQLPRANLNVRDLNCFARMVRGILRAGKAYSEEQEFEKIFRADNSYIPHTAE